MKVKKAGEKVKVKLDEFESVVMQSLKRNHKRMSAADVAGDTGISHQKAGKAMKSLQSLGAVEKVGGRFRLTGLGKMAEPAKTGGALSRTR